MASPPPSSPPEKPPLPPNIFLSEDDLFSDECRNPNYDTGFRTAPSSPPHTNLPTDSLPPQKESTVEISSPSSSKLLQQPNIGPFRVPLQGRDAVPSHHLLKFENFSLLSKASIEKYSSEFEAGGYKWNLCIYPTGDKNKDGEGHISIYLEMLDTSSLHAGWEVNAIFNFFVFDQLRDKYVSPQDVTVRRFHCLKTQWGIVKFIDLESFNDPSNGYLVNDTCSFGVEVFVVKTTTKAESLSMINNPLTRKIAWTFPNVSKTKCQCYETEPFVAGDYKWRFLLYPNGYLEEGKRNNNITLAVKLDSSTLPFGTKIFLHYTFLVVDQKKGNDVERSDSKLISSAARGFRDFMSQAKFKDLENGFLVDDKCEIEVELKVLGLVTLE
ncbi:uncharacterized protein LOC112091783 isoform X2 [Morus notabilis]|uniref:uncharacterized protein LOC112091783 isoform X2 n=1 Tax=Morus notabilis TaxID=981085 RepID=UPI000CED20F3|nr:uncharacterized protein LOC112091783 isoform X2 [Morus notabilis]